MRVSYTYSVTIYTEFNRFDHVTSTLTHNLAYEYGQEKNSREKKQMSTVRLLHREHTKNQLINVKTGRLPSPIGIRIFRLSSFCVSIDAVPPMSIGSTVWVAHGDHKVRAYSQPRCQPLKVQSGWYGKWMTQFLWVGERRGFMRVWNCDASLCHGFLTDWNTSRLDRTAERSKKKVKCPLMRTLQPFYDYENFFAALPGCRLLIMRFNRSFIIVGCLLL